MVADQEEDHLGLMLDRDALLNAACDLCRHHLRVVRIARELCSLLRVPFEEELRVACGMHDVGKLAVLELVSAPRRLSEREMELVRLHPLIGAVLLTATGLGRAADAVLRHHERWDGSGYPNGIGGERIPLYARILGVADMVAALTEPRAYRGGRVDPEAEIAAAAGTALDPEIARAALFLIRREPV